MKDREGWDSTIKTAQDKGSVLKRFVRFDGRGAIDNRDMNFDKKVLLQLLLPWSSEYYRRGMIQCATTFKIINQSEWEHLYRLIKNKERCYMDFET
jgi:hypothetical protein